MKKWLMSAALVTAIAVLAGCSAGGTQGKTGTGTGSGGTTTPPTATAPTVALALSSTSITAGAPATVAVTVKDSTGKVMSGVVVTFTTNATVGTLSSATALTNTEGIASVTLSPASATAAGADTLTVSATVAGLTGTASAGYQVNSSSATIASVVPSTGDSASDALSAYGQAVLTVTTTGASNATPITLNVTSTCVGLGKATISPATISATSNTTVFTYKDSGGCGSTLASDTAAVTIANTTASAMAQVFLTSPVANSITFTAATPPVIYLKGSGNVESSTVQFKVVDTANNPLPGQSVTLNLSTFAGGLTLNQGTIPVAQTSDANGLVSVIVNSGTVPTPVQVTATLASGVKATSTNLAVLTGLPTQTGFQLNPAAYNIEGFQHTIQNTYTIYATDRSQNPVPDHTAILFWAEKGLITGTATTTNGSTTTTLTTSAHPDDGRVTVLAYAVGEESFHDLNHGTNAYQAGDPYQDLGNVVKSSSFDGGYNPATDEIVSLSDAGGASGGSSCTTAFDLTVYPDFAFNATVPNQPGTCDGQWSSRTYVRRAVETVLSMDSANPLVDPSLLTSACTAYSTQNAPATISGPITVYPASGSGNTTLYVGPTVSGSFTLIAADANPVRINPMAAGSIITATPDASTNGEGLSVAAVGVGGGQYTYPTTTAAQPVSVNYTFGTTTTVIPPTTPSGASTTITTQNTTGFATVSFRSVGGLVTSVHFKLIMLPVPTTSPCQ